jgi:hypothetical protein
MNMADIHAVAQEIYVRLVLKQDHPETAILNADEIARQAYKLANAFDQMRTKAQNNPRMSFD